MLNFWHFFVNFVVFRATQSGHCFQSQLYVVYNIYDMTVLLHSRFRYIQRYLVLFMCVVGANVCHTHTQYSARGRDRTSRLWVQGQRRTRLRGQDAERATKSTRYTLRVQAASKGSRNSWADRNKAIVVAFSFWWAEQSLTTRKYER